MKWTFWLAAGLIVYAYAGYAVFLRFRLLWKAHPVRRQAALPSVSIVMVVRNEEKVLKAKLNNLLGLDYPEDRFDVVVVSDGSTDRTAEILREYSRDPRLRIVLNQLSRGKAAGLNDALTVATGEIVLFTDARQRIEPFAPRLLVENFADPEVGCASGELMLGDPVRGEVAEGVGLYWRVEKTIRELESCSGSVVGATGALYAVRRELLISVPPGTILDDVYLPMQVVRQGKRVVFDPRARAWDVADQGARREFSRKVRTLSGNYQLLRLAPWLLSSRNPIRFEFISHKILRLIVPLALIAMLLTCVVLKGPFYRAMLAMQLTFYALSTLSLLHVVKRGVVARVANAAGTFVLLNGAAALAFANFLSGKRVGWR